MIEDPIALSCLIAGLAALAFWLEGRFRWAQQIGASLLIILLGATVSNAGIVPGSSVVYSTIMGPLTSLAIVWLLLAVDLRDLRAAGPRMLAAFAVAVVGTAAGVLLATLLLAGALPGIAWRLAGAMMGTYSGGSVNFAAVGREVGLDDTLFVAAAASDTVLTAVWVGATLMLPLWLRGLYPRRATSPEPEGEAAHVFRTEIHLRPFDALALATLGFGILWLSETVAEWIPAVPAVLWLTTTALVVGLIPPVRRLRGAFPLGLIALNLFFAVIGIGARVAEIFTVGIAVFYFTAIVVAVHGVVIYGGGRLLRLDVESLSVASQAAVGGPSTAMALSVARGWKELALPGVMVGLLGYALGNYAGLAMAWLMRQAVGG